MIAEFTVRNFFSIRTEQKLSFIATSDTYMDDEYCYKVKDGVRLLKMGVVYGANASGKSNILEALSFFKHIMIIVPKDKTKEIKFEPFLFDDKSKNDYSEMSMTFYLESIRYSLAVTFDKQRIYSESLYVYQTNQPSLLYKRTYNESTDSSELDFGIKSEISRNGQIAIEGNTINNCSVMAAFGKSNLEKSKLNSVYDFFSTHINNVLEPRVSLLKYTKAYIDNGDNKFRQFVKYLLKASDFNIEDFRLKEKVELIFKHKTDNGTFELNEENESAGTLRFMGMVVLLHNLLYDNCFMPIDEFESSLHYELLSYLIRLFLTNSENTSQLFFTTHDINLLNEDFIRQDAVWFTDKNSCGETLLERLSSLKLRKSLSPYNAYKQGKLVKLPFTGSVYLNLKDF